MKIKMLLSTLAFASGLAAIPAIAQSQLKTYLSRSGSNASNCYTPTTPCTSLQLAIANAGPKGEVFCLDRGNYFGGVVVSFSITISCEGKLAQMDLNYMLISTAAGDVVVIEGADWDIRGSAGPSIVFNGAGTLHVRSSTLRYGTTGIDFKPNGPATLFVTNTDIDNNSGIGINIQPAAGGYANVHLSNVRLEKNTYGLVANGSTSAIGVNVNMSDSKVTGNNSHGIYAFSTPGTAPVNVNVGGTLISGNGGNGMIAQGAGGGSASITVSSSMIVANGTGVGIAGAGQVRTLGNNHVNSNGANGAFTGSVPLQ